MRLIRRLALGLAALLLPAAAHAGAQQYEPLAASVQAAVPKSLVSAAWHHVPAKELGELSHPVESDVLVCSDHPSATATTLDIVSKLPNLRPLDAGELSNAAPIEAFAAVLLQVNMKYRTRVAIRFTGLDDI